MKNKIKSFFFNKKLRLIIILIIFILVILFLILKKNEFIREITRNIKGENNSEELFSYIMYDNQDKDDIKVLVKVTSEYGIEYIETPDNRKILNSGNKQIVLDYEVKKDQNYVFKIKEVNQKEIERNLLVNDEYIDNKILHYDNITEGTGITTIQINKYIDFNNFIISYKFGEDGIWEKSEGEIKKYDLEDFYLRNLVNDDGTVTFYIEMYNEENSNKIILDSKKYKVYVQDEILEELKEKKYGIIKYDFNVPSEINIEGELPRTTYGFFNDNIEVDKSNAYKRDDGYFFVGWGKNKEDKLGIANFTMPEEDVTLYAIWSNNILDYIMNPNIQPIYTVEETGNGTHRYNGVDFGCSVNASGIGNSNNGKIVYRINIDGMQDVDENYKRGNVSASIVWYRSTYTKPWGTEYWNYGANASQNAEMIVVYDDETTDKLTESNVTPTNVISSTLTRNRSLTMTTNNTFNKKIKELVITMQAYCSGRTDEYHTVMNVSSSMLCNKIYFTE